MLAIPTISRRIVPGIKRATAKAAISAYRADFRGADAPFLPVENDIGVILADVLINE